MMVKDAPWVGRCRPAAPSPLATAYWCSGVKARAIATDFGIPANQLSRQAGPAFVNDLKCRVCGENIIEESRTTAGARINSLDRTYGWSRDKYDAQACRPCVQAERKAQDIARWKAVSDRQNGHIPHPTSERLHELKWMPYADYIASPEWQAKRNGALKRAGYACQVCYSNVRLHVHHRTYANRGHEDAADLTVLCAECHELFHAHRQLAENRAPAPKEAAE